MEPDTSQPAAASGEIADDPEGGDAARGRVATDAAEVYDEFFVPALFDQWPPTVLDAAGVEPGDRVLDVGCGTGVLARAAAERAGGAGEVIGLDPNPGMLAVAERSGAPVTWRSGAAEAVPLPDAAVDRVVSQFVLMFVDDAEAAVSELARVLRPGGGLAVATWSPVEESPGYAAMVDLLRRIVGEAAADALLAPFTLGDPDELSRLLARSFPDVVVDRHEGVARFASIDAWLHTDIRGWTLSGMIDDETYERLRVEAHDALADHVADDGSVRFPAPALLASATGGS